MINDLVSDVPESLVQVIRFLLPRNKDGQDRRRQ
jgi:hypothetical protein